MTGDWKTFRVDQDTPLSSDTRDAAEQVLRSKVKELVGGDDEGHISTIVDYIAVLVFESFESMSEVAEKMIEIVGEEEANRLCQWLPDALEPILNGSKQESGDGDEEPSTTMPEVKIREHPDIRKNKLLDGALSTGRDSRKRPREEETESKSVNSRGPKKPNEDGNTVAKMYSMYMSSGFEGDFAEYQAYLNGGSNNRGGPRSRGMSGPSRGRGGFGPPARGRGGFAPSARGRGGFGPPARGRGGFTPSARGRGGFAPPARGPVPRGPPAKMQWSRAVDGSKDDKLSMALPTGRDDFVAPEPDYQAAYSDFGIEHADSDQQGDNVDHGEDGQGPAASSGWGTGQSYHYSAPRGRGRGGYYGAPRGRGRGGYYGAPRGRGRGGYYGAPRGAVRPGAFSTFQNKQWVRKDPKSEEASAAAEGLSSSLPVTPPPE